MKRRSGSLVFREAQIKILMMYQFIHIRLAHIPKSDNTERWRGCRTAWAFIFGWWECTFVQSQSNLALGSKTDGEPTPWPCSFTHILCPRETFACVYQESGRRMFPEALLLLAKWTRKSMMPIVSRMGHILGLSHNIKFPTVPRMNEQHSFIHIAFNCTHNTYYIDYHGWSSKFRLSGKSKL